MPLQLNIPPPTIRALTPTAKEPTIDLEKRTILSEFVTRSLARDGGILDPAGAVLKYYLENPVVLARHGLDREQQAPVIGRTLAMEQTPKGITATVQFAETDLALDYARLHGVNEKKEVYMRGWSVSWDSAEYEAWSLEDAQAWLGADWDEDAVPQWLRNSGIVWYAGRWELTEFSSVEVGCDRNALSRAHKAGVRLAGEIITRQDLTEARGLLAGLAEFASCIALKSELRALSRRMRALAGDGAAAGSRGDTAELLDDIRRLARQLNGE